jgi:hypothetical protein
MKLLGIISVDFDAADQLLIMCFVFYQILKKKWTYNGAVHQLWIDFKVANNVAGREVLHNIFVEFGIPMTSLH